MENKEKSQRLAVNINADIHAVTKMLAARKNCTQGKIVEDALISVYQKEIDAYTKLFK